jgi:hypothetical protein
MNQPWKCPWKSLRDSHISTASITTTYSKRKDPAGGLLCSSSGSSFDEKMLKAYGYRDGERSSTQRRRTEATYRQAMVSRWGKAHSAG